MKAGNMPPRRLLTLGERFQNCTGAGFRGKQGQPDLGHCFQQSRVPVRRGDPDKTQAPFRHGGLRMTLEIKKSGR